MIPKVLRFFSTQPRRKAIMVVLGATWREDQAKAERIVENPLTSVRLPDDIFLYLNDSL